MIQPGTSFIRLPNLCWERVRGSDLMLDPEESGYIPSLGHKLNDARCHRHGKNKSYGVTLTKREMADLREFCESLKISASQGGDRSEASAFGVLIKRIDEHA